VRKRSWLGLIVLCICIALVLALGLAIVGTTVELAFAAARALPDGDGHAAGESYVGVVADSICGAKHETDSDRTSAECTQLCVKKGAKYVLIDGDKVYTLTGESAKLSQMAGLRVRVWGSRSGDTIQVQSAAMAQ
jgi:hypothetical protein